MALKIGLQRQVAHKLQKANIRFFTGARFGGISPDFLLKTPDGKNIVLEVKEWEPTPSNQKRAIRQVELFKKHIGADEAFIVLSDLKRSDPSKGLLSPDDVADVLSSHGHLVPPSLDASAEEEAAILPKATKHKKEPGELTLNELVQMESDAPIQISSGTGRLVFAAMPFGGEYDDTYFSAMVPAAQSVNAVCKRVDQEKFQGDIIEKIKKDINESAAVISDLSESNPNVLYETGYAHGLGRPTIHISSTPLDKLPFDVRNWKTIKYAKGQTYKLKEPLERELKALLGD